MLRINYSMYCSLFIYKRNFITIYLQCLIKYKNWNIFSRFFHSINIDGIARYQYSKNFWVFQTEYLAYHWPLNSPFPFVFNNFQQNRLIYTPRIFRRTIAYSTKGRIVFHALHFQDESHECYEMYASRGSFFRIAISPGMILFDDRSSNNVYISHQFLLISSTDTL